MKTVIGLKMIRDDFGSLNDEHGRLFYRPGMERLKAPGNGAYIAVTAGLNAGGLGPLIALVEGRKPTAGGYCVTALALTAQERRQDILAWDVVCCAEYRVLRVVDGAKPYADYKAKCATLYDDHLAKRATLYADHLTKLDALYADHEAKSTMLFQGLIEAVKSAPKVERVEEKLQEVRATVENCCGERNP